VCADLERWQSLATELALGVDRPPSRWNAATTAHRTVTSEVAAALRVHERAVERWMHESSVLNADLPQTLAALGRGEISYRHAQKVIDVVWPLEPEERLGLDAYLHPKAAEQTVAQWDRRAKARVARLHPEALEERKRSALDDRRVCVGEEDLTDGMGWLQAYLPAEQLVGIKDRVTELARAVKSADDPRTIAQIEADVLKDLLIAGEIEGVPKDVRAQVMVTVPVLTLLGLDEEPARCEHGPTVGRERSVVHSDPDPSGGRGGDVAGA
jgi:hypothetical protein